MTSAAGTLTAPELLWRGPEGDAYHKRHTGLSPERAAFWKKWAALLDPRSVLEVGCGTGANLEGFPQAQARVGLDVSATPLRSVLARDALVPVLGSAGRLPFLGRSFELVVTAGCLIHVPYDHLGAVLFEIGRVAARDVLLLEYDDGNSHVPFKKEWVTDGSADHSTGEREIPWRGHRDVLWARSYGYLFWRTRADFSPMGRADLGPSDGFDRVTLAWFRRRAGT